MVSTGCSGSQAGDISYMAAGHHENKHRGYLATYAEQAGWPIGLNKLSVELSLETELGLPGLPWAGHAHTVLA